MLADIAECRLVLQVVLQTLSSVLHLLCVLCVAEDTWDVMVGD